MLLGVAGWPDPSDLLPALLLWLRVPLFLVGIVVAIEWAYGWIAWIVSAVRAGSRLVRGGRRLAERWNAGRLVSTVLLVPCGAVLVACCYSLSQLVQLMGTTDGSGRNLADGELFDASTQWERLVLAARWPDVSQWAVWLPIALILAMGVAQIGRLRFLGWLTRAVVRVATFIGVAGIVVVAIAGCAVVGNTLFPDSGYNVGMASLYIAWIVLLGGSIAALRGAASLTRRAFG